MGKRPLSFCPYEADTSDTEEAPTLEDGLNSMLFDQFKRAYIENIEKRKEASERNRLNGLNGGAPKGNANARKQPKTTENNPKQPKTTENNPKQPKTTENNPKQPRKNEIYSSLLYFIAFVIFLLYFY